MTQYEKDLEAVKQDGYALRHVKEQTPELCLEAVKQNGYALRYVKEQTPEICLEAVKQDRDALDLIDTDKFKVETIYNIKEIPENKKKGLTRPKKMSD